MNPRGRPLSPAEREFFVGFFRRLATAGVPSVLLRNYADFPDAIGHDVDVFFRRADLRAALAVFQETLGRSGGEVLHVHERDYVLAVWFRVRRDEPRAIHLDFYHGALTWHGLPYLGDDALLAGARPFKQFQVPRPAHEALNLFLTSLLWGGFFKARYGETIRALIGPPREREEFHRILAREFGAAGRPPFDFADAAPPSDEAQRRYARRLRRAFRWRAFTRKPLASLGRLTRFWWNEFATVFAPPGVFLAVMGPDGSGKSTVLAGLKDRLEYFFGETVEGHWRPSLLPDVGVLLGARTHSDGPVTDPHGRSPQSALPSVLRLFYYWLDYWLGWPRRIWKLKAKNHLVLFDRYVHDLWCDPRRYRLGLSPRSIRWLCRLTPQPDFTFVLLAAPEVIQRRKQEVPLATLRESLARYAAVPAVCPNAQRVDCAPPAETVVEQVCGIVLDSLRHKAARRLGRLAS